MSAETTSASAWILPLADGQRVAVGGSELVHVLAETPALAPAAHRSGPCTKTLLWEGSPALVAELAPAVVSDGLFVIVAFDADGAGVPAHGAVRIAGIPSRRTVVDDDAAPPEAVPSHLRRFAHAAFRDTAGVVPVLDLHALFAGRHTGA